MARRQFDVVIIGGGNAGMGVTVATREKGLSVAMIEPDKLGGTCSNRGCTPKKVLVAAAHALDEIERAATHRIKVGRPKLDWPALIEREKAMIADIPVRLKRSMEERGVALISGRGRFVGRHEVAVGDDVLEAGHIVIATGSRPRDLPIPGAGLMITSDEVLSEPRQPKDVVFVGGGVIAFEFAHVYARAGTKVTILEVAPQFLANFEQDAVAEVLRETRRIGVDARAGVRIERIEKVGRRLRVAFAADGAEETVVADRVVNGAGRVADLAGLDLAAGDVAVERGRVVTDGYFRSSSNPAVYACGDALAGKPQLSPIATHEGRLIGEAIAGSERRKPDYASIPACLYTVPALATVGMTEAAARDNGLDVRVEIRDMRDWLSGRTYAETVAWSKIVIERESDRVVGAHIVGHAGDELIHLFALAMRHGITAGALADVVYAFPTFAADLKSAL
jgi:glutathione reductase (NADPH)